MLTDVQKEKLAHLFKVMDSDQNGFVAWDDYQRLATNIASSRGWKAGSDQFEQLMGQYKFGWEQATPFADKKKGMDLERWYAYNDALLSTPGIYDALVRPAAHMIFDTFDVDGDQKVTVKEWREFFRAYSIDPAQADKCFGKYDLNGDGYVSRSELVDLVGQFYLSSDPGAPGNLLFGPYN
jgi:Ca2+-binding EF-hand superfamily protein